MNLIQRGHFYWALKGTLSLDYNTSCRHNGNRARTPCRYSGCAAGGRNTRRPRCLAMRIPLLTPEGQKREADRAAARSFDSHETRPLAERCIVWRREGSPMLSPAYNDILQIFQAPGYVAILQEMSNNGLRIIPLARREAASPTKHPPVPGDSRGRWEVSGDPALLESGETVSRRNAVSLAQQFCRRTDRMP